MPFVLRGHLISCDCFQEENELLGRKLWRNSLTMGHTEYIKCECLNGMKCVLEGTPQLRGNLRLLAESCILLMSTKCMEILLAST